MNHLSLFSGIGGLDLAAEMAGFCWTGGYSQYKERMQCYGNAVVPQQFYPIFQAIADIEKGIIHE